MTDHKFAIEDKFVKLKPNVKSTIDPTITWLAMLNELAVSDSGKLQLPEFKLYPELQFAQTEESETEHVWQLLAVHFFTVSFIILLTGLDNPETVETM